MSIIDVMLVAADVKQVGGYALWLITASLSDPKMFYLPGRKCEFH